MVDSQILDQAQDILRIHAMAGGPHGIGDLMAWGTYYLGQDQWGLRRQLYDHLAGNKLVEHIVPMGHGKSSNTSEMLPMFFLCNVSRDFRVLIASETKARSEEASLFCRTQMDHPDQGGNPRIAEDFGSFVGKTWQVGKWTVSGRSPHAKGYSVAAAGSDSASLGKRVDYVIGDDVISLRNTQTQHQRDKILAWWDSTIGSRLNPSSKRPWPYGGVCVVGNHFDEHDLLRSLKERKDRKGKRVYALFQAKAYLDEARTEPLLPEYWTVEDLLDAEARLGPAGFELSFMNNPGALRDSPLREKWFRYWTTDPEDVTEPGHLPKTILRPPLRNLEIIQGWDLATSEKKRADYTVCATLGIHWPTASFFWLDFWRKRKEAFEVIPQLAIQDAMFPNVKRIKVESNGFQSLVARSAPIDSPQLIKKILKVGTGGEGAKRDRIIGTIQPSLADGRHYFPRYGFEEELMEVKRFPKAGHDDVPDAMAIAMSKLIKTRRRAVRPSRSGIAR